MASTSSSIIPAQQNISTSSDNNNNNNNNNNRNNNDNDNDDNNNNNNNNNKNKNRKVGLPCLSCPRCRTVIGIYGNNSPIEIVGYSVLRPDGRLINTWDTCLVIGDMVNVRVGEMVEVHLGDFETPVSKLHCNKCSANIGWKSAMIEQHYVSITITRVRGQDPNSDNTRRT